jgi:hypothetical protein
MDYSGYLSEILTYERVEVGETERSLLFKIMNTYESSAAYRIASYFKLRRQSTPYYNKMEYTIIKGLEKIKLIEEVQQESFLRESIYYKLTTYGLFYIFSNTLNYPPQLLTNYHDNIILKTLLFQYFEINTIKHCTARFYPMITQYLNDCCSTSVDRLDIIKSTSNVKYKERYIKALEYDLKSHAKVLGFKLAIMYNESNILMTNPDVENDNARVTLYELENKMKLLLSRDNNFMQLLQKVEREFGDGYKELMESKK